MKNCFRFSVLSFFLIFLVGPVTAELRDDLKEVSNRVAPSLDDVEWLNQPDTISQSIQGKVLLVNFWATWCPPCVEELPSIQETRSAFSQEDFEVVAINAGETVNEINSFLSELATPLDFPIVLDKRLTVYAAWQVRPLPTTFLVDRHGNIRYQAIGPRNFSSDNIKAIIQALIDE